MHKTVLGVLVAASLWLAPRAAAGSSITVVNFGFELPAGGTGGFSDEIIAGWVVDTPDAGPFTAGVYNPPAGEIVPSEGVQVAYLGPFASTASSISQILGTDLQASTRYTLRVDVGRRAGSPDAGFGLALLAGGSTLASITDTFLLPVGTMSTATLVYHAPADLGGLGGALEIRLFNPTGIGQTNYDNVRLDETLVVGVAEPGALIFLVAGLALLAAGRLAFAD
jgi:hypothetical protein